MTKEEMNKNKAEIIKNVLDYKNTIQSFKKDFDTQKSVIDRFISIGLRSDASIKLKDICIELALNTIQNKDDTILFLINFIDSIGDSLIDAYSEGIKEIETED